MSYAATVRYLFGLQYRGIKVGLRNIRYLAAFAGHPERSFPVFHIAGTNGKGSTSSFLASILTAAGYRTGLYTSPHLLDFSERIRIDGVPMPSSDLVAYARQLRPAIEETGATFFEATTCIAFQYFADQGVDVAVIETGLGGRLDATNIVQPLVSIITNIGLDHQEYLGTTVRAIAREKAGIIKQGAPVVTGATGEALHVIRSAARLRGARLYRPNDVVDVRETGRHAGRSRVRLRTSMGQVPGVLLGLGGDHQVANASLAVAALALVSRKGLFPRVDVRAIALGLAQVTVRAGLRCRLERIRLPWADVTVDVAHNPDGVRTALAGAGKATGRVWDAVVFGAMKDKDYGDMLGQLGRVAREVIVVRPRTPRAATVAALAGAARARGLAVRKGGPVARGILLAKRLSTASKGRRKPRILIIGSHYVAAEALLAVEKTP